MLTNNPKPIQIKTNTDELKELIFYINNTLSQKAEFKRYYGEETIFFYRWHLEELKGRCYKILINNINEGSTKPHKLKVYLIEQKILSKLFKIYEIQSPYMLIIENKLINGLVNTYDL